MLYAYLDESVSEDWFFLTASILPSRPARIAFEMDLGVLVEKECARLGIPCAAELHGHELFQGRGAWAGVPLHDRLAVAGRALRLASEHEVKFLIRGLDRAAQRRRYAVPFEPYGLTLTHAVRALHHYANDCGEQVSITCDEYHHHDRHRAQLDRHRTFGAPGFDNTPLAQVAGELTFVPSHDSGMIQIADLVCYLRHRQANRPNPDRRERRARRQLWANVQRHVVRDFIWVP